MKDPDIHNDVILTALRLLGERNYAELPVTDVIVEAIEAAVYASRQQSDAVEVACAAVDALPPFRSGFERGMAYGMAFMLAGRHA